ncbi:hypothetical protein Tco_0285239 [Tanacetum coccineum]
MGCCDRVGSGVARIVGLGCVGGIGPKGNWSSSKRHVGVFNDFVGWKGQATVPRCRAGNKNDTCWGPWYWMEGYLKESSFGMLVETSMDGPAGLVFGPAGAVLGPAELAHKTTKLAWGVS